MECTRSDPKWLYKGKKGKDCSWFGKNANEKRCEKKADAEGVLAKDACPCECDEYVESASDDALTICEDDADWRMAKNGKVKSSKDCAWLAEKGASKSKCKKYRGADGVKARDACGCVCSEFN